jgi:hypothetical protein
MNILGNPTPQGGGWGVHELHKEPGMTPWEWPPKPQRPGNDGPSSPK